MTHPANLSHCRTCRQAVVLAPVDANKITWRHVEPPFDQHYAIPDGHVLTDQLDRLARRLAVAREGMLIGGPAPLVVMLLNPVKLALDELLDELERSPVSALTPATSFALSDDFAEIVGRHQPPTPDTIPEWLENGEDPHAG